MSPATTIACSEAEAVPHRGILTVCALLATLMQALGASMPAVVLHFMQTGLYVPFDMMARVMTVYFGASVVMAAPIGWLAQRVGFRRILMLCIGGFTVASIVCAFTDTIVVMVSFRLLQGVFGGGMVVLSWATVRGVHPPATRTIATLAWAIILIAGSLLGHVLGAYLTMMFNWCWMFLALVPLGILALLGLACCAGARDFDASLKFGWLTFAAIALAVGVVQFPSTMLAGAWQ